jgi:hypothetical protein
LQQDSFGLSELGQSRLNQPALPFDVRFAPKATGIA